MVACGLDTDYSVNSDFEDTVTGPEARLLEQNGQGMIIKAKSSRRGHTIWVFHGLWFLTYTFSFIILFINTARRPCLADRSMELYSPVQDGIEIETRVIDNNFTRIDQYKGKPSKELDDAWNALLENTHIRVWPHELQKMNAKSIALSDEKGGYFAAIDVYHQLHCLKYLRQAIYADSYVPPPKMIMHADHCVDSIRQSLMCSVNPSLITYKWKQDTSGPEPQFLAKRECVNWEKLDSWARDRMIDVYDQEALVHPFLGPAFPEGPDGIAEKSKVGEHVGVH